MQLDCNAKIMINLNLKSGCNTIAWLISSIKVRDLFPNPAWLNSSSSAAEGVLVQPLFTKYTYTLNGFQTFGFPGGVCKGEKRFLPFLLVKGPGNDLHVGG